MKDNCTLDNSLKSRMKRTRKKYGASSSFMSKVCGFGVNSWRNYEAGQNPCEANLKLIEMSLRPYNMMTLLDFCYTPIKDTTQYKKVLEKVNTICVSIKNHAEIESGKIAQKINIDFSYD
jgi:hypothetical protein